MTVTLHLKPEIEAGLLAQARAVGMPLEEYVLSVVESAAELAGGSVPPGEGSRVDAVQRMLEFGTKYRLSLGEPITRALTHEAHRF